MKKVDYKAITVAVGLFLLSIFSSLNWELVSNKIMLFLSSNYLTYSIWALLIITSIIHYHKNYDDNENNISEKEGLEKPMDYFLFVGTYGVIGTSVQVLSKEIFASIYFKSFSKCSQFSGFDIVSFTAVILILILYSYNKLKPIIQETYITKSSITLDNKNLSKQ